MPTQLVVRADPDLIELIQRVAKARGEYVADLVRRAKLEIVSGCVDSQTLSPKLA